MPGYEQKNIPIRIGDGRFWFQQKEDGAGAIAYLHHCDESGDISSLSNALSESFAHVFEDRTIKRHGRPIGNIDEVIADSRQPVESTPQHPAPHQS